MLAKDTLRQSDVLSGVLIAMLGVFIVSQAMGMPMKDSWGGVQNVWYVSPALFPLFVGTMLLLLGLALTAIGLRHLGRGGIRLALAGSGGRVTTLLTAAPTIRFYAVVATLLSFVFILVPRVDFFAAAPLYLLMLFALFYYGDETTLFRTFMASLAGAALFLVVLCSGLRDSLADLIAHPGDWLALLLTAFLAVSGLFSTRHQSERRQRLVIGLIVTTIAPLTIGIIFKYLLLVPMPHEGLVVQILDAVRYAGR